MSSHHIVRDEQEPAVYVSSLWPGGFALLGDLLEWSPLLLADLSCMGALIDWGVKVDAVVCQAHEKAAAQEWAGYQPPMDVVVAESANPAAAFGYIGQRKGKAVNWFNTWEAAQERLTSVPLMVSLYADGARYIRITDRTYEKWLPSGARFEVISPRTSHSLISGDVARQENAYQMAEAGFVRIEAQPPFWMKELF